MSEHDNNPAGTRRPEPVTGRTVWRAGNPNRREQPEPQPQAQAARPAPQFVARQAPPISSAQQSAPVQRQTVSASQPPAPPVSGGAPVFAAPAPVPPPVGQPFVPALGKARGPSRAVEISLIAISLVVIFMLGLVVFMLARVQGSVTSFVTPSYVEPSPPSNTFSVLYVVGEMLDSSASTTYQHAATVEYIKNLTVDSGNTGILLYMDTPGGGVYESDELYRALDNYRAVTGRPVWVYMAQMCASGGVYAAVAADNIVANYNTTTGSIGVYISMTDTSGLYEKFGVKTVLVRSGDNKGVGTGGVPITDKNVDVYQDVVDEKYERFLDVVAMGRNMDKTAVRKIADGRVFTAEQAVKNGLVDELAEWDSVLEAFRAQTASDEYYPVFATQSALSGLLYEISGVMPKSDAQAALDFAQNAQSGVPMAMLVEG